MASGHGLSEFLNKISSGREGLPISIDEAQEVSGLNRAAVLDRFRKLQTEGEGYLRLGRHGHPTRFYFRSPTTAKPSTDVQLRIVAPTAQDRTPEPAKVPARETTSPGTRSPMVEHHYQLRADLRLSLSLPSDLTEREAGRVARFVETLPL